MTNSITTAYNYDSNFEEVFLHAIQDHDDEYVRQVLLEDPELLNWEFDENILVSAYIAKYGSEDLRGFVFVNPKTDIDLLLNYAISYYDKATVRHLLSEDPDLINHRVYGQPFSHIISKMEGFGEEDYLIFSSPQTDVNSIYECPSGCTFTILGLSSPVSIYEKILCREDFTQINHPIWRGTLLHRLLVFGGKDFVEKARLLINDPRIDLTLRDCDGDTALDIAIEKGFDDLAELIRNKL